MISNAMIMMATMTVKETDLFHTMANGQQDEQVTMMATVTIKETVLLNICIQRQRDDQQCDGSQTNGQCH